MKSKMCVILIIMSCAWLPRFFSLFSSLSLALVGMVSLEVEGITCKKTRARKQAFLCPKRQQQRVFAAP